MLLSLALLVCIVDFFSLTSTEKRFMRAVSRGVSTGWEQGITDNKIRAAGETVDWSFVSVEYEMVESYEGLSFNDKKVEKMAQRYIRSVKECAQIVKNSSSNKSIIFQRNISEPYAERIEALYDMYKGGCGLIFYEKKYGKQIHELMLQGWAIKKASAINLVKGETKEGNIELVVPLVNDSGMDIEYIDFTIDLYGDSGIVIESISAYAENVKKNEKREIKCFVNSEKEFEKYSVSSINCKGTD